MILDEKKLETSIDYYSFFNLSHFFNYKIDCQLPNLIIHYCLLKQKCEKFDQKGKSNNYSYEADFDSTEKRFRFSYRIPKNLEKCVIERSKKKDEIINSYLKIQKINKHMENLSLIFYNYCTDLAEEIYLNKKEKYNNDNNFATSKKIKDYSISDNFQEIDNLNQIKIITKDIPETKPAFISSLEEENQKLSRIKNSIINNSTNSSFILKIGHLMVNCEKVLKNKKSYKKFFVENENKDKDNFNNEYSTNFIIKVNEEEKSIGSYEFGNNNKKELENDSSNDIDKINSKSINSG